MKAEALKKAARYIISSAGIIIGIAVAMVVLGMSEGGRSVLRQNFWNDGVKVYDIKLKEAGSGAGENLKWEDAVLLADKMPEVRGSIPVLRLNAQLKSYKASGTADILAVNEKYPEYANIEMLEGSFINSQDVRYANKAAVIDELTAIDLYGTTDIVGQKLHIQTGGKKVEFLVTGVCKNYNRNIETLFDDELPGMCFIPDSVPEDTGLGFTVEKLIALVTDELHEEEAAARLSHLLEKEHGAEGAYSISEYEQLFQVEQFTDKYTAFAVIISIVALISGSIGVMNAMLLTVQERKKEIGIYKFYGLGIRELQYDILYKTLIVCLAGGAAGMLLGLLAGAGIGSFVNIRTGITFTAVFMTAGASALAGLAAGLHPAAEISRVDASEVIWGEI